MANDRDSAAALGVVFLGLFGLLALGSLAAPLGGSSQPARANDTPPTEPKAQTAWYLRQLQGTRVQESATRTRELLNRLSQ